MTRFVSPARTRVVRDEVRAHRDTRPAAPGGTISLWAVLGAAAAMLFALIVMLQNGDSSTVHLDSMIQIIGR